MQKIIGVIGGDQCNEKIRDIAISVGEEIAKNNCILICGGLQGVMEAACFGAKKHGGLTIGILPGDNKKDANKYVDIPIVTGLSWARNIIIIRTSDAVIAIDGEYGTLSEIAYALKLKIPIIGIDTWKLSHKHNKNLDTIIRVKEPKQAVQKAVELIPKFFSKNFGKTRKCLLEKEE